MAQRQKGYKLPLGGMARTGDSAQQPDDKTRMSRNTVVRPGRIEGRSGLSTDTNASGTVGRLAPVTDKQFIVGIQTGAVDSFVRKDLGTTQILTGVQGQGSDAYCQAFDKLYGTRGGLAAAFSYDGTNVDLTPFDDTIVGRDLASGVNRVFAIGQKIVGTPIISEWDFTKPIWEKGAYTWPTVSAAPAPTFFPGTQGTLMLWGYNGSASGGTASDWYVRSVLQSAPSIARTLTWQHDFFFLNSTFDVGVTMIIEDGNGNALTKREIIWPANTPADCQRYGLSATIPAGSQWRVKIVPGTTQVPYTNPTTQGFWQMDLGFDGKRGAVVKWGAYFLSTWPIRSGTGAIPAINEDYPSRIGWCETDKPNTWLAEAFVNAKESPGDLVGGLVGAAGLGVFKRRGMWYYKFTDNVDLPLAFVDYLPDFGLLNNKCKAVAFGQGFWVDDNGLYVWDFSGSPKQLLDDVMREYLLDQTARSASPWLVIDTDNKEIIVQLRSGLQHVLNLVTNEWTEWQVGNGVDFTDAVYTQLSGQTRRELWVSTSAGVGRFVKNTTTDTLPGQAPVNVIPEQWLHTFQAEPQQVITIDGAILLTHLISTVTNLTIEASFDNGLTWPYSRVVPIGATNLALNSDAEATPLPIRVTGRRIIVRVKGEGGPSRFALVNATANLLIRGVARPDKPAA